MPRLDQFFTKSEKKSILQKFDTGRIYIAKVKDTRSVLRAGDIKVWLYDSGIDENDSDKWIVASYFSPFYGTTPYETNNEISFDNNPTSFGAWLPMPYVGNKVGIFFPNVNGENLRAYWFGCPVDGYENSMIPGIPSQYFGDEHLPLTEMNNKNIDESYSGKGQTLSTRENAKAVYRPLKNALDRQGLTNDKLRGYSTAGTKRESPSMCYGILTPLGNSFTMDDGWSQTDNRTNWNMLGTSESYGEDGKEISKSDSPRFNAGFRFRTRNGTQLLIGDEGNIYMINRDGTAWAEISDDGHLRGYAKESADIACDGDINLHSKRKIRMEADEGFVMKSNNGGLSMDLAGDLNIHTPHINTDTTIYAQEINAKIGNIESFQSQLAQCNGVFKGTLTGIAEYATNAGTIPLKQPDPNVSPTVLPNVSLEDLKTIEGQNGSTQSSVNTFVPTAEPYDGHNRNDSIPKLEINNVATIEYNTFTKSYPTMVSNQVTEVCPTPPDTSSDKNIPAQNLTEHFTLADLCYSATAKAHNITNVPDAKGVGKLKALCENVLEKIWAHYNQKVIVNSGYRGPAVNALVGGASTSQHSKCEAADVEISGLDNYTLACWIRDNLEFDQLILEFASGGGNNGWVHVSWKEGKLRHQCLTINKSGTRSGLIRT